MKTTICERLRMWIWELNSNKVVEGAGVQRDGEGGGGALIVIRRG